MYYETESDLCIGNLLSNRCKFMTACKTELDVITSIILFKFVPLFVTDIYFVTRMSRPILSSKFQDRTQLRAWSNFSIHRSVQTVNQRSIKADWLCWTINFPITGFNWISNAPPMALIPCAPCGAPCLTAAM